MRYKKFLLLVVVAVLSLSVVSASLPSYTFISDSHSWFKESLGIGTDLVVNGSARFSGSPVRLDLDTNLFFYDTAGEAKHLNSIAENYDELKSNTFSDDLILETFTNSSGTFLNVSSSDGSRIGVTISNGTSSNSYTFDYNSTSLSLTQGTNITPVKNWVYVYDNSGVATWGVSTSDPAFRHAFVGLLNVGSNGFLYWGNTQPDEQEGFVKKVQKAERENGIDYEDGLGFVASSSELNVSSGYYTNGVNILSTTGVDSSVSGVYTILSNGSYEQYSSLSDLILNGEYGDGNVFGSNKYVNVVLGVTPYNGASNLYAVVQDKPVTEYTSVSGAFADNSNSLNVYPSDRYTRLMFIPVARMVFNTNTGVAQEITTGVYAEDYTGGLAGGVTSGGGLTEVDPLSVHVDGSVPLTGNWDAGSYNISASHFIGDASGLTNLPAGGDEWSTPVDSNIVPDGDNTRNLGAAATEFASTYTQDLVVTHSIRDDITSNTRIDFSISDNIWFYTGGERLFYLTEGSQDEVVIGDGGDVDLIVSSLNDNFLIFGEGSTDRVGIGTNTPSTLLDVDGVVTATEFVTPNGGVFKDFNSTCVILLSPAGTGNLTICD